MEWPRNIPWTVLRKEYSMRYLAAMYGREKTREFIRRHQHEDDQVLAGAAIEIAASGTMQGGEISQHEAMAESLVLWDRVRTFILSPDLVAALRETDPGKIDEGVLHLPFHWIYLDVGLDPLPIPEANLPTWAERNTEIRGFLLTDLHPSNRIIGFLVMHCPKSVDSATGLHAPWHLVPFSLHKAIEFQGDIFDPQGVVNPDAALELGRTVMRLAVNAIKYINCVNADLREERLRNPNVPDPRGRVFPKDVVGKSDEGGTVRRCGFYINLPQVGVGGGEGTGGWKVGVRFLVRGHWHRFWTGPRDGERKLVTRWVEPFWKGPDAAEQMHQKIYKVEAP